MTSIIVLFALAVAGRRLSADITGRDGETASRLPLHTLSQLLHVPGQPGAGRCVATQLRRVASVGDDNLAVLAQLPRVGADTQEPLGWAPLGSSGDLWARVGFCGS